MARISIYAKVDTNEKVMTVAKDSDILQKLSKEHGGRWVLADTLESWEHVKFEDSEKYTGFSTSKNRYIGNLHSF